MGKIIGPGILFKSGATRVGELTVLDPRSKFARIELDGVDVTRGYIGKTGIVDKVYAANDIEGWILTLVYGLPLKHFGEVRITFEPCDAVKDGG